MKRLDAAKVGWLIWNMNRQAVALGISHANNVMLYDHSTDLENEFVRDVIARNARSKDIVEKWKDAVLVFPDGTEERMDNGPPGQVFADLIKQEKK